MKQEEKKSLFLNNSNKTEYWKNFYEYILVHGNQGIASAMLLRVLGCDMETIYLNHFAINQVTMPLFQQKLAEIDPSDAHKIDYYKSFFIAKKAYIDEYFKTMRQEFGTFDDYIEHQIGLSKEEQSILRKRYLDKIITPIPPIS